jgi:hypothetical protein
VELQSIPDLKNGRRFHGKRRPIPDLSQKAFGTAETAPKTVSFGYMAA